MALTDNLVSYYKFDNVNDSVGGKTLTNVGTVEFNAGGIIGNDADFGATNSTKSLKLIGDNSGVAYNSAITISLWVKLHANVDGTNTFYGFMNKMAVSTGSSGVEYQMGTEYNGGTPRVWFARFGSSNIYQYFNTTLGTTTWHHLVSTWDTTNFTSYLDGIPIDTDAASGEASIGTETHLIFGQYQNIDTGWLRGMVDEVGIWSRALSAVEVSALYNAGSGNQYDFTNPVGGSLTLYFFPGSAAESYNPTNGDTHNYNADYTTSHDATSAAEARPDSTGDFHYAGQFLTGGSYHIYRGIDCFDTSYLPDSCNITAAVVKQRTADKGVAGSEFNLDVYSATINGTSTIIAGDYNQANYGGTSFGSIASTDISATANTLWSITLSNFSGINKTGVTTFAYRTDRDVNSTTPSGSEYIAVQTRSSSVDTPRLEVTYSITDLKTVMGITYASVKTVDGIAVANVKSIVSIN